MRKSFTFVLAVFVLLPALAAMGAESKQVTLSGAIACAKCAFKVGNECRTAVKVSEAGKDVIYLFDEAADKKYHEAICKTVRNGKVTGVVSEKDGKKLITVSKVEYDK